jgi:hypothetical protein
MLIGSCPTQINVIKRLVEYIQEDINRMIRLSAAYASNTSMGSTNNVYSAAGGMMSQTHNRTNHSPAQNTLDQLSNHSVSPNTEGQGLFNRMPYH